MAVPFLPYGQQNITDTDVDAVVSALKSPFLTTGPKVAEFEEAFAHYVGAQEAVAVSNGTAALHLACMALGVKPGDCVLTPSMSFAASTNGAAYCGAKIEFMDCDPKTGLITPELFSQAVARAHSKGLTIKAAVIVHINGEPADMAGISAAAETHGIALIEDSCHALGTTFEDHEGKTCQVGACRYSTFSTFSTHPVKTITTGEGGLITTNDAALAKQLRVLRTHGLERDPEHFQHSHHAFDHEGNPNPWYYEVQSLGYNYRLTDIACALGISQLQRMDHIAQKRREHAKTYDELFAKSAMPLATIPAQAKAQSVRHLYPVLIDYDGLGIEKSRFVSALREKGVGSQVHYVPTHYHPLYAKEASVADLAGAETYYNQVLSLPLYPELTSDDCQRVVETVDEVLNRLKG